MEIQEKDLQSQAEMDDLIYELIEKYYPDYDDENFDKLDKVTQNFVLIIDADGQINNGGVIQFIDNSTGNRFHETVEAAKEIGNETLVTILTKASTKFPDSKVAKDWEYRRELLDQMPDKESETEFWEKLDDTYYDNSSQVYSDLLFYLKSEAKLS